MKTICIFCNKEFNAQRSTARFCSSTCRAKHCMNKSNQDKGNEPIPQPVQNLRGVDDDVVNTTEVKLPDFNYRQKKGMITIEGKAKFALANKQTSMYEKELVELLNELGRYEKMLYQLENAIKFLVQKPRVSFLPQYTISDKAKIKPLPFFSSEVSYIEEYPGTLLKEILQKEKHIDNTGIISIFSAKYSDIQEHLALINDDIKRMLDAIRNPIKALIVQPSFIALLPSNIENYSGRTKPNNSVNNAKITLQESSCKNYSDNKTAIPSEKIISSKDLAHIEHKSLRFREGWEDFFGRPETNFQCAIHGRPGGGKSTFAIMFAAYLAINHGPVIYISSEEGFSKTFKDKLTRMNAITDDLHVADLRGYDDIIKEIPIGKYPFIVIDSLDNMHIDADKLKLLRFRYKNSAIITISQATKDGKMRGSYEIIHDADIEVIVSNGLAVTNKNRYKENGRELRVF